MKIKMRLNFRNVFLICFLLFALVLFSPYSYLEIDNMGVDDANIFFVFAKNFISGNGLVWNVGEGPVEGFTSLFWLFFCSMGFLITDNPEFLLFLVMKYQKQVLNTN